MLILISKFTYSEASISCPRAWLFFTWKCFHRPQFNFGWLLQVALCDIYAMIIKHCPWYSEHVTALLPLAYMPEIVYPVGYCIELALATLGAGNVGCKTNSSKGAARNDNSLGPRPEGSNEIKEELNFLPPAQSPAVDCPDNGASTKEFEDTRRKRRKLSDKGTAEIAENTLSETSKALETEEDESALGGDCRPIDVLLSRPLIEQESICPADLVHNEFLQMMENIEPKHDVMPGDTSVESKLAALHVLVKVFIKYPNEVCNQRLIQLFHDWVLWILEKVTNVSRLRYHER